MSGLTVARIRLRAINNMLRNTAAVRHTANLVGITGLSLVVVALFAPNVKMGAEEFRTYYEYHKVQRLQEELSDGRPVEAGEIEENDLWGTPYVVRIADDGGIEVRSAGANMEVEFSDSDGDDIWSGMPRDPMEPYRIGRKWAWIRAFASGGAVWILLCGWYWCTFRPRR